MILALPELCCKKVPMSVFVDGPKSKNGIESCQPFFLKFYRASFIVPLIKPFLALFHGIDANSDHEYMIRMQLMR